MGGVQPKSLGVLSKSGSETSEVPGVLIETGNLKHKDDVANLNSRSFRDKLVQATFNGIVNYLKTISGYDATKTQTLKNINGTFTWVDD